MAVITPEILDEELKKSGRSQSALARAMGVDPAIVNRMVRGLRQIKAVAGVATSVSAIARRIITASHFGCRQYADAPNGWLLTKSHRYRLTRL